MKRPSKCGEESGGVCVRGRSAVFGEPGRV